MTKQRPYVLSIAGFDPSAGAGLLADIKAMESCEVYGMGVVSALTVQNDSEFEKVEWLPLEKIVEQIDMLQRRFSFEYIKIGLIQNLETLNQIVSYLISHISKSKIIWDPILKASAGFDFHQEINHKLLEEVCKRLYLVSPNITEAFQLGIHNHAEDNAKYLSQFCHVYLKGGHNEENRGTDILFTKEGEQFIFENNNPKASDKHGSGCVLSSAMTAGLAKGLSLESACKEAKAYISDFLASNNSLLGYHSK